MKMMITTSSLLLEIALKDKHENDREVWLKFDPIFDC
jgi:hypothetical protein